MAKPTGIPTDEPILIAPGVTHKEGDHSGAAKWLAVPPESAVRAAKGDLSMSTIKDFEPRPLTHKGLPFVIKGGK